ncbi:hypothetical protein VZT92_006827 [Zoarces viviparus]|uniref:Uncharacterized protein n=1 Tax=Zoarces viviparus TaxID=48416 RepID=A0AAW1FR20_ZOAVI
MPIQTCRNKQEHGESRRLLVPTQHELSILYPHRLLCPLLKCVAFETQYGPFDYFKKKNVSRPPRQSLTESTATLKATAIGSLRLYAQ